MDANERQMISGLFDRMRAQGSIEKDRDAEALISQAVRQTPDAAYMMVQSVLVQEQTLQQAGQRIEELEDRVRQLEMNSRAPQQQPASGGFLGGLFGGSKPAAQPMTAPRQSGGFGGSVPATGGSPWGGQRAGAPAPMMGQQAAPAAGGGFMKTAMATAAGVAGGMLLADSIRGMMNPNAGSSSSSSNTASAGDQQYGPDASQANTAANDGNDPGYDDNTQAASDDGADWGGGDMDV